jgi:hypothetical protein
MRVSHPSSAADCPRGDAELCAPSGDTRRVRRLVLRRASCLVLPVRAPLLHGVRVDAATGTPAHRESVSSFDSDSGRAQVLTDQAVAAGVILLRQPTHMISPPGGPECDTHTPFRGRPPVDSV